MRICPTFSIFICRVGMVGAWFGQLVSEKLGMTNVISSSSSPAITHSSAHPLNACTKVWVKWILCVSHFRLDFQDLSNRCNYLAQAVQRVLRFSRFHSRAHMLSSLVGPNGCSWSTHPRERRERETWSANKAAGLGRVVVDSHKE